jgi:hypothetical protein
VTALLQGSEIRELARRQTDSVIVCGCYRRDVCLWCPKDSRMSPDSRAVLERVSRESRSRLPVGSRSPAAPALKPPTPRIAGAENTPHERRYRI